MSIIYIVSYISFDHGYTNTCGFVKKSDAVAKVRELLEEDKALHLLEGNEWDASWAQYNGPGGEFKISCETLADFGGNGFFEETAGRII